MGIPVYVSTATDPGKRSLVYAILDSASDHSYITVDLAKQLKPRKLGKELINVETMTGETKQGEVTIFGDIIIKGYFSGEVSLH